jgi:leucyl-tRNA synthetase
VEEFGADAMRVYEMFMGPFSQACAWSTNGLIGSRKFLEKVVKISNEVLKDSKASKAETGPETERLLHQTIKKVGEDIEQFKLNTAISQMMILVNKISEEGISQADWTKFVQILSPFAPHLAEELWERLGYTESIFKQSWPKFDSNKLKEDTFELVVQVNGKLRARITVPRDIDQAQAQDLAQKEDRVQKFLQGKGVRKVIFVPGKLVNLVV